MAGGHRHRHGHGHGSWKRVSRQLQPTATADSYSRRQLQPKPKAEGEAEGRRGSRVNAEGVVILPPCYRCSTRMPRGPQSALMLAGASGIWQLGGGLLASGIWHLAFGIYQTGPAAPQGTLVLPTPGFKHPLPDGKGTRAGHDL
ncbi:hypothetical protein E6O75_ATG01145 [Venturia nashicola]|uniref:Uncharacterized protein n=1 Tax=Venturia nashicola TaxID=86259 RepID=A0A4Z1PB89_9PEZI|nr:hypothetical protein E6O75_ATG01145 [Venturia nashicola]